MPEKNMNPDSRNARQDVVPVRHMRFTHSRQVTADRKPEICVVTRLTKTTVYFQNSTGFRSRVSRDRFSEAVHEVLPAE